MLLYTKAALFLPEKFHAVGQTCLKTRSSHGFSVYQILKFEDRFSQKKVEEHSSPILNYLFVKIFNCVEINVIRVLI